MSAKHLPKELLNFTETEGDVVGVIVDCQATGEIFFTLTKLGISFIKSASLDFLYSPVNTHPDMQIHFIENHTAVAAPSVFDYYKAVLPPEITLIKGAKDPGGTYPGDCAYNVARLGNKIIGNISCLDTKIKEIYQAENCIFIDVKQGYTKCNLCIINENSVITEDEGLFKTLSECGIDVLKITPGFVKLSGFPYGFIGGASGSIDKNTVAFFGNLKMHPQYEEIKSFAKSKQVDIICLSSTELSDFGSILYFDSSF